MGNYTGTLPSGTLAVGAGLTAAWTQQAGLAITALGSAWTAYTPTLSGFTLGNGTVSGRYTQVGKIVWVEIALTFGTTTTAAAAVPTFTLPVNILAGWTQAFNGKATFFDTSAGAGYNAITFPAAVGTVGCYIPGASGLLTVPSTTTPFTWANTDTIVVAGNYEAA